jgi:steroid delta-isomerase-like uncharacterized protein
MSKDINLAAQERLGELVNGNEIDKLDEVFHADVVDHDPAPAQGSGPQGFKDFFTTMRTAFPDLQIAPQAVVADDEHVSLAYTITGTHQGEFNGIAPTGKRIEARGVQIGRFEDGKIIERWGSSDELGILAQLGAEPSTD